MQELPRLDAEADAEMPNCSSSHGHQELSPKKSFCYEVAEKTKLMNLLKISQMYVFTITS